MAIDLIAADNQQQRVLAQPQHCLEQVQLRDDIVDWLKALVA